MSSSSNLNSSRNLQPTTEIIEEKNPKKRKLYQATLPFLPTFPQIKKDNVEKIALKKEKQTSFKDKWLAQKIECFVIFVVNHIQMKNNMIRGTNNYKKSTLREHLKLETHTKALQMNENKLKILKEPPPNIFKTNREKIQFLEILPLLKGVYWISKENLSILKFDSLINLMSSNNVKINQSYRNRKAGLDFLQHISETIRERLVKALKDSKYFGITIDSSADISYQENLAITIRYLDETQ